MQEKAKTADNAGAYRMFLTNYCAKSSHFKEMLPCAVSAYETHKNASHLLSHKFHSYTVWDIGKQRHIFTDSVPKRKELIIKFM